ncbi:GAF domain-containing protein [Speluncibacter jeojiensis]|uniref:GAF domain-containing protein n=1 Tax=Speluncibacter jeojiensis TaxID=2710754 RepID=A0A9X4RFX2_9ACTN|nr:GAF domain-containing protein [Corynebacteriales bacterium D3-21]
MDSTIDELLQQVRSNLKVGADPDRLRQLLEATLTVSSGLELDSTLRRIVETAAGLVDARYGALGVRGPTGDFSEFVYVGIDDETRAGMGRLPYGHGVLGEMMHSPETLRIEKVEAHHASIGYPPGHPRMETFMGVPILVRGEVFGSIYLTEKVDGSQFSAEDEVILKVLACAAAVAIDNSRLYESLHARQRWLSAQSTANAGLLRGASVPDTLEQLVRDVCDSTPSTDAFVVIDGDVVAAASTVERARPVTAGTRLDRVLADDTARGRVRIVEHPATLGPCWADYQGPAAVIALPLAVPETESGSQGVLVVIGRSRRVGWSEDDLRQLTAFADVAGVAVAFTDEQCRRRELDVLAERDRIARDLHDHVIQSLFATGMTLQSVVPQIQRMDGDGAELLVEQVNRAVRQLDRTVRQIRTAIFDLHSSSEHGLRRTVLDTARELGGTLPEVEFFGPVDTLVPPQLIPHVEAVVRESVSNALRHSCADQVSIAVTAADHLSIIVSDNGIGIDLAASRSGLVNLEQRARLHGGDFEVERPESGGTRLAWTVPLGEP